MAPNSEILPEGTDTIIPGAAGSSSDESSTPSPSKTANSANASGSLRDQLGSTAADLRGQATDKARDYAAQGKERAVGALDNVVKLVEDAAGTIDEKVGAQYGDYARRAAESISGFATTIREKDIDELARDARDAVRKSPAIAIGAAAAVGFLIARVIKSASTPAGGASDDNRSA